MQQHVSDKNDKLSFNLRPLNERETILIEMLQNAPSDPNICDIFRLEILLEDYLSQARTFNKLGCNYQGDGCYLKLLHMQDDYDVPMSTSNPRQLFSRAQLPKNGNCEHDVHLAPQS